MRRRPDSLVIRPVLLVLAGGMSYFGLVGMSFPLLPRLVENDLGHSSGAVGAAFALTGLGMLAVRPFVGYLADLLGRRRLVMVGAITVGALQLLHVPAADRGGLAALLVVRLLVGAAGSLMYVGFATIATEIGPLNRRGQVFATFSVAIYIGLAVGPFIAETLLDADGFAAAFGAAAAFGFGAAGLAWFLPETRPADTVARIRGVRDLFHPTAARVGFVNLMSFLSFMGFNAFITPFAETRGVSSTRWLLATYAVTTLVSRAVSGPLLDTADRRRLGTMAFCFAATGAFTLGLAPGVSGLYVGAVVLAFGLSFNVPLLMLVAADSAAPNDRSKVVGTVVTFGDIANSFGALALGIVADATSYETMYLVLGCSLVGSLLLFRSPFLNGLAGLRSSAERQIAAAR